MVETMDQVEVTGPPRDRADEILTAGALELLSQVHRVVQQRRAEALASRKRRRAQYAAGRTPAPLPESADAGTADWTIAELPADLADRRIEVMVPPQRRFLTRALRSDAKTVVVDFEDTIVPAWANVIAGHVNLLDAWSRRIWDDAGHGDKDDHRRMPALMIRPRGLHRWDTNILVDGEAVAGAVADLGLALYHTAIERNSGRVLHVYLPELEDAEEAAVWADILTVIEQSLALPAGAIKVTAAIETLPAAFQVDEIMSALRERLVALTYGRANFLASAIRTLGADPRFVLPDPEWIVPGRGMLRALSQLVVHQAHRRGALAIGPAVARIVSEPDEETADPALEKVRADIERAVADGHDGVVLAHPSLAGPATEVFDRMMPQPNQLSVAGEAMTPGSAKLREPYDGERTEDGLRGLIAISIAMAAAELQDHGIAEVGQVMHHTASGDWAFAHALSWVRHAAVLADRRIVTPALFEDALAAEAARLHELIGDEGWVEGRFDEATEIVRQRALAMSRSTTSAPL